MPRYDNVAADAEPDPYLAQLRGGWSLSTVKAGAHPAEAKT